MEKDDEFGFNPPPITPEYIEDYPKRLKEEQETKELVIKTLTEAKKYTTEIPKETVSGTLQYKAQHNWFAKADMTLLLAKRFNLSQELTEKINKLDKKLTSEEFQKRDTTEEDIEETDQLINQTLSELQNSAM